MLRNYFISAFLFSWLLPYALTNEETHSYQEGDDLTIWVNTVGPYSNRQETYEFYQLPYCKGNGPKASERRSESLGEALQGVALVNSGTSLKFKKSETMTLICNQKLSSIAVEKFRYAVEHKYWFEKYIDDLPLWGFVGNEGLTENSYYLYTHSEYAINYNEDRIIQVKMTSGNAVLLPQDNSEISVNFTYSVTWKETTDSYENRFDKYLDSAFFEHRIHWFSVFNSFMMVIFLTGLVAVIVIRALRKDYARYDMEDGLGDLDRDLNDEYGWKQVHADVFRSPPNLLIFSSFLGTGFQLVYLAFGVIFYTIMAETYVERASILTSIIVIYALTSVLSGYYSGSFYQQHGGKKWIKNVVVTACLWPCLVFATSFFINFIAISYSSTRAIPFTTMLAMACILLFLVVPLTLFGAIIGRNWAGKPAFPCRVNPIPRPIPEKVWYFEPLFIIAFGGLLPFGSIFIEIYFVFTSFWAFKIYYVYGFLLLIFLILLIVTSCVTIMVVYFVLNSEDHRWHWIAFMSAGSTAIYVYLYSIYYYFAKTKMYGFFQTTFYFGYTALVCIGLCFMLGTVGFIAGNRFIRKIYANVKVD